MSLAHWLALSFTEGLGPRRVQFLLSRLGSVKAIFQQSSAQWSELGFKTSQASRLVSLDDSRVQGALAWRESAKNASILTWECPDYPPLLREITDAPLCLYVQGSVAALSQAHLAVVGSRHPTTTGLRRANQLACALAERGIGVVSGLALGIDAAAHRGALLAGGVTIGVLATGLDQIYPAMHRSLVSDMLRDSGVLVSEQPLGTAVHPSLFPRRNRLISGLSLGTLVIEAGLRSGSLITASQALSQNREVLAMPGSVDNPLSKGCHALLREGAALVESIEDIMISVGPLFEQYGLTPLIKAED